MTDPTDRPPLDLDAIRARAARYEEDRNIAAVHGLAASLTSADVGALLAEVTALRAELDAARAELARVADALATHTPPDLDAIRARADAATPGPWAHGDFDDFMGCGQVFTVHPDLMGGSIAAPSGDCYPRSGYDPQADMAFIANARHDIPALLAEVTALRAELDAARAGRNIKAYVYEEPGSERRRFTLDPRFVSVVLDDAARAELVSQDRAANPPIVLHISGPDPVEQARAAGYARGLADGRRGHR